MQTSGMSKPLRLARMPTGITGLDTILKGGLFRGGLYIVEGPPGSGKTTLATQIAFGRARAGEHVVYVTLLSESHDRLLQYLGNMSFVDMGLLPDSITFVSAFPALREGGLPDVLALLRETIRSSKPSLVVLDGLYVAQESATSEKDFREFLHAMQGESSVHNCTLLFLTSGPSPAYRPERTMVDGIISLSEEPVSTRTVRFVHVLKFRGSATLQGQHGFRITDDGLVVSPRLEAAFDLKEERPSGPRISSGIPGLDAMIGGGIPGCSSTLLIGPTGSGKTTAGLIFLSQATPDDPGLFFGCYEMPERLKDKARSIGIDVDRLLESGALVLDWHKPFESFLDEKADRLQTAIRRIGARRVFIDGIGGFRQTAVQPERLNAFFSALTLCLRHEGVTTLCSVETPPEGRTVIATLDDLSPIAENIILLRYAEYQSSLLRAISVLKLRDGAFDSSIMPFEITDHGIRIGEKLEGIESILRGAVMSAPSGR